MRTMEVVNGKLIIHLRPYESLIGLLKVKTMVKQVAIRDFPNMFVSLECWFDLSEMTSTELVYFPYGLVAIYNERRA